MRSFSSPAAAVIVTAAVAGGSAVAAPAAHADSTPVQKSGPATTKAATAAKPDTAALVRTGPSPWKGERLRHPRGGKFPAKVERWANLVSLVMAEHKVPQRYLPGVLAQIQQESSGRPKAVNRWDSNARRGTPSKGLLQVIAPTYRHFAKDGFRHTRYQTVPYTNIYASLNYVKKSYGMGKFRSWSNGHNQGY